MGRIQPLDELRKRALNYAFPKILWHIQKKLQKMKLLLLDSTYRRWLNSRGALALDGNLIENFIGLTHSESIFFAEMSKAMLTSCEIWKMDELESFVRLHNRHEAALNFRRGNPTSRPIN